ncbi:putative DNA-binding transcriptional regulator YafY [Rhodococcus sp. OK611]|uniref:helix-turn-helix transcriptional regulator n=1 Tax=unclassified Rhodococcus (in: high G+C Gram-positive bacteria) TaxID=192944 RepID=UPI000BD49C9E|nr:MULTISPECIES: YafY family protein [unclassified Rhodococcus (in: high G+C Gram-positive bacteria)]PTR44944.1 putative DNA-binding transcriptional regulator YafY [Rhodococcus sp. OK611]SNX89279.1 Predicted DNA-binding transcriptional regulator YafY, contains an HTH and WYL domains [Rhodococcus sp. OK270]
MRSSRLLDLMLRLQGGPGSTAERLAEQLEVSVRTVYRDVAALQAAGVPLWTESGPGGGIRLLDGWQFKLSGMTGVETSALMLLGVPGLAADLGLGEQTAAAEAKLLGAMPLPLRAGAELWRSRLHVDAPGWFGRAANAPHLATVARAVLDGRRVRIGYRRGGREVTRTLDPLGLVAKAGIWYLVAAHRGAALSFRVSRVEAAVVLDGDARRPDDFDLAAWWARSAAEFDRSLLRYPCRVRLAPAAWRSLPAVIGPEAARVTPGPADADGWVEAGLLLESEEVAVHQLTALGAGVEVLEPASLRAGLRAIGAEMARRNG